MSLIIEKENEGILICPRAEEVSDPTGCMYPRVIEIRYNKKHKGSLLATFEHYIKREPLVAPIYRSTDGGINWEKVSEIEDTKNHFGLRFQPVLYELEQDCGDLKKGTICYSVNSVPFDHASTELVFFISRDGGDTWEYRSSIAQGGKPIEQNFEELGPVWEPYLYINKYGDLTCVYSDERPHDDPNYNQTLALTVSKDGGKTWSEKKLIVAIKDRKMRPGMPIVAKMANGKYFMCYEIVGKPCCDIYCRISEDGLDWGNPNSLGKRPETKSGFYLGSMPYCIYTKNGGPNGAVILSAKRDSEFLGLGKYGDFLVNYNYGEGEWFRVPMLIEYDARILWAGWSKGMTTFDNDSKLIQCSPVQTTSRLMHISYGIGYLKTKK